MKTDREALLQEALKGRLTPSEAAEWQGLLKSQPDMNLRFKEEIALDKLLGGLRDVPLSSNFTALAVQAALREEGSSATRYPIQKRRPAWSRWVRFALAGGAACLVGLSIFNQQQVSSHRELAESIKSVSEVATLPVEGSESSEVPAVEVWQNFDAIYRMGQLPRQEEVDQVLLVALEQ